MSPTICWHDGIGIETRRKARPSVDVPARWRRLSARAPGVVGRPSEAELAALLATEPH